MFVGCFFRRARFLGSCIVVCSFASVVAVAVVVVVFAVVAFVIVQR